MNYAIITPTEADTTLAIYSNWVSLENDTKLAYIRKASVYIQTKWTCAEVDYEGTIPDEIKEACAYYAYANFSNNLFNDVNAKDVAKGTLKSERKVADVVEKEQSWYPGTANSKPSPLSYPNTLMAIHCTVTTSNDLIRV